MHKYFTNKLLYMLSCIAIFGACNVNQELEEINRQDDFSLSEQTSTKALANEKVFYWHRGKQVFLSKTGAKKYVVFEKSIESLIRSSAMRILEDGPIEISGILPFEKDMDSSNSRMWAIVSDFNDEVTNLPVLYLGEFFVTEDGLEVGLSHLAYVKLYKEEDINQLIIFSQKFGFRILGRNEYMPLWITIDCSDCISGEITVTEFLLLDIRLYYFNYFTAISLVKKNLPIRTDSIGRFFFSGTLCFLCQSNFVFGENFVVNN